MDEENVHINISLHSHPLLWNTESFDSLNSRLSFLVSYSQLAASHTDICQYQFWFSFTLNYVSRWGTNNATCRVHPHDPRNMQAEHTYQMASKYKNLKKIKKMPGWGIGSYFCCSVWLKLEPGTCLQTYLRNCCCRVELNI